MEIPLSKLLHIFSLLLFVCRCKTGFAHFAAIYVQLALALSLTGKSCFQESIDGVPMIKFFIVVFLFLKGQCHEIFASGFFHESVSSPSPGVSH